MQNISRWNILSVEIIFVEMRDLFSKRPAWHLALMFSFSIGFIWCSDEAWSSYFQTSSPNNRIWNSQLGFQNPTQWIKSTPIELKKKNKSVYYKGSLPYFLWLTLKWRVCVQTHFSLNLRNLTQGCASLRWSFSVDVSWCLCICLPWKLEVSSTFDFMASCLQQPVGIREQQVLHPFQPQGSKSHIFYQ